MGWDEGSKGRYDPREQIATVHQIQCPGHPEAARCSEETKCATVKRKEEKKGEISTYTHVSNEHGDDRNTAQGTLRLP